MFKRFFPLMEEAGEAEGGAGEGGGQETQIAEWAANIEDEGLRSTLGKFESRDEVLKVIGYEPPKVETKDWRESIEDKELKKVADRFNSPTDALRAVMDLRKRESQARVPGKDASEDEVAKYKKAIGVPEAPDQYEWPELPEDKMTPELQASREVWGKRFLDMNIPKETAKVIAQMVNEDTAAYEESLKKADEEFAKSQEQALRKDWGGDYEKNHTLANRAFEMISQKAGVDIDVLKNLETKDGRFMMDNAALVRVFATIGREMDEGTLGPSMTESEAEGVQEQIATVRKQMEEAQYEGNSKKANQLYRKEQDLIAKLQGNKPIVGAGGRGV